MGRTFPFWKTMVELLAASVLTIIAVTLIYSYHRQISYSLIASAACVLTLVLSVLLNDSFNESISQLGFFPRDLVDADYFYTVLTSMYAHGDFGHLLFNVIALAFIGTIFEERIGTRPFILIFLITGFAGTLTFAVLNWNEAVRVVGASGAVSGILGAFVRLYSNLRMSLVFVPQMTFPAWFIVVMFLLLQLVWVAGDVNIAVEAHLGGLVMGMILAPVIVKVPLHRRVKKMVSQSALRKLATTPELKAIMRRIEDEEIPDIRSAGVEHFLANARCPHCGSRLKVTGDGVLCEKGHML
jgi:membrane associated rhomboid family serine protease